MDRYDKGVLLGRGTFASVFKATHKETGKVVAIKKIDVGGSKEGINVTSLREIKLLREIRSPYVVELLDVFPHKRKVNMVMEFLDSDLEALIKPRAWCCPRVTSRPTWPCCCRRWTHATSTGCCTGTSSPTTCSSRETAPSSLPTLALPASTAAQTGSSRRR
ncbi:kinase-like domain-containing protein [Scenedesmus sp. NREL 46B-D3]|nr:kinase-like domain-containing protein [Scenedesmus sp. NREL 46B-D3]